MIGDTALMCAARFNSITCFDLTIVTNVKLKNKYGDTALICAARFGHAECARAILQADRSNLNADNDDGHSAYYLAKKNKHEDCANMLKGYQRVRRLTSI